MLGPAGKATMQRFARRTCDRIPNFMDLYGTAWKVPVHMDPNLALRMELNSYESRSVTACRAPSRPFQITGHGFHGTTLPMASIEPSLQTFAQISPCTDLHRPDQIPRCMDLHRKRATGFSNVQICNDSMQVPLRFHVGARHCTTIS